MQAALKIYIEHMPAVCDTYWEARVARAEPLRCADAWVRWMHDTITPPRAEHIMCEVLVREQHGLASSKGSSEAKPKKGSYAKELRGNLTSSTRFKRRLLKHVRVPLRERDGRIISVNLAIKCAGGAPSARASAKRAPATAPLRRAKRRAAQ